MNKLLKISNTKAFQVQTVELNETQSISVRQMYATTKEPDDWKPSRNGILIPYDDDGKTIVKALVKCFKEEQKFKTLELKERSKT